MPQDLQPHQIPISATRFAAASPFLFVAAGDGNGEGEGETSDERVRVQIHARDAQPVQHPFWGKIAHDMAGVVHKDRLAIDYCHDPEALIGYVDQVSANPSAGLDLAGDLLPKLDGRAAEIVAKGQAGVPYESSIDWTGPAVIEYVDAGEEVEVNGYQFAGPGYVARKWHLRGVAICPHGIDMTTNTTFAAGEQVPVEVFSQSGQVVMPNAAPAEASEADADQTTDRAEEGRRFIAAYGDWGAKAYAEGLSFEAAGEQYTQHLAARLGELDAENAELRRQIDTLRGQMGEDAPVTSTPEGARPGAHQTGQTGHTENVARFRAAIRLPSAN